MKNTIVRPVFIAVFAAIISAGCVMAIPLPGGVPISVQNMFCMLAGTILGGVYGALSVLIWLLLGVVGIPVFSNARSGIATLLGPSGGYIVGYALAALAAGLIAGAPRLTERADGKRRWVRLALAALAGYVLVYVPGIPWFMHVMAAAGKPQAFAVALKSSFIPFIPGDTLKLVLTVPLAALLRPIAARYLQAPGADEERAALDAYRGGAQ